MAEKKRTELDWTDIRTFNALARYGSLSATARALCVNHATIARRIAALELALGERLVERRPRGYVLTDAGRGILGAAAAMDAAAAMVAAGAKAGQPSGLVRVNATPSLAHRFLANRLARFVDSHPRVDIELATNTHSVSLDRYEADIALRLEKPQDGALLAKPLVSLGFGFYAASEWNRRIAAGNAPVLIGFDEANAHLPEALWLSRHFARARFGVRASSQLAQAEAASAGCGIALLPHFVGRTFPDLETCNLGSIPPSRKLWLVSRPLDRDHPPIRLLCAFLIALFAAERTLFEGEL